MASDNFTSWNQSIHPSVLVYKAGVESSAPWLVRTQALGVPLCSRDSGTDLTQSSPCLRAPGGHQCMSTLMFSCLWSLLSFCSVWIKETRHYYNSFFFLVEKAKLPGIWWYFRLEVTFKRFYQWLVFFFPLHFCLACLIVPGKKEEDLWCCDYSRYWAISKK